MSNICYDGGVHTYLLALEVTHLEVGSVHDVLPAHCTLVHRFRSDLNCDDLIEELRPILDGTNPLLLLFEAKDVFGPPPVVVNKIAETDELMRLHLQLCRKLDELAVEYTAPQWVGVGYKPHVTERPGAVFSPGDSCVSTAVCLIEVMVPGNEKARFIRHKFALKGSP